MPDIFSMTRAIFAILLLLAAQASHAGFEADLSATSADIPALRTLHARASAGDADAQFKLGGLFFNGQAVDKDDAEAARWFRLAASQGHSRAQFNLGMMYATGQGVPDDHNEAVRWYRLAATQGLAVAQLNLGVAYATGEGAPQSWIEAAKWMRLAADQSEAQAQFNLAVMYAQGQGVARNPAEAHRYAKLAAAQGFDGADALAAETEKQNRIRPPTLADTTDMAAPTRRENGEVYIQLGALKSQSLAEIHAERFMNEMRARIGDIGKPYSIHAEDGWVRVQLGPYPNATEARRIAKGLKAKLGFEPLLKQRNPTAAGKPDTN